MTLSKRVTTVSTTLTTRTASWATFFSGVGQTLAEVILSLDLNEEEREDLASDLDELHDQLSDYGVEGLSVAIAAAEHGWDEAPRESGRGALLRRMKTK